MSTAATQSTNLLTTRQAAEFLGLSPETLLTWRCTKQVEIPYIKLGKAVRYRREDLEAFINENLHAQEA